VRKTYQILIIVLLAIILIGGILIIINPGIVGFVTGNPALPQDTGPWAVHFCPGENCADFLNAEINMSQTASCAFYDINLAKTAESLRAKQAKVYVDDKTGPWAYADATPVKETGLMHHKFCVLDQNIITTGSFNPTYEGNVKDNNNFFVVQSRYLHENYAAELKSLAGDESVQTPNPLIIHNGVMIENYFCPRDDCETKVVDALAAADRSIYFFTYTFTSDPIETTLIGHVKNGLEVKGVIEKSQSANKATYVNLDSNGVVVHWDGNPKLMHHKVFIIDNETVIFGSYNPTKAATTQNRENILIIHSSNITRPFLEEWARVWSASANPAEPAGSMYVLPE
jgi:phosphatidylserine/phosphatidylglycerophosphate/cardiolipin synthase-like enzyme